LEPWLSFGGHPRAAVFTGQVKPAINEKDPANVISLMFIRDHITIRK
jgi:hypothetical protein